MYLEVLNHDIEIYSAKINVIANLNGLRYLMFHWPISSAFIGIGSNLLFIFFIFSLSWRHIYGSEIFKNKPNGNNLKKKFSKLLKLYLYLQTFWISVNSWTISIQKMNQKYQTIHVKKNCLTDVYRLVELFLSNNHNFSLYTYKYL